MRFFTLLAFIAALLAAAPSHALGNRLANHPSPYLALHAGDAVAWQEWTPQTLALAKQQNKLIFLSLGYFSCQGCHKMQIEALGKGEFADFLNRHFIPVLVDRELLTALDNELQAYALQTQGLSGWPLNVILTPEGHPLRAIFYESPQQMLASASYLQSRWAKESKALLADARAAADVKLAYTPRPARITPAVAGKFRNRFLLEIFDQADTYRGGFGNGAKYPMAPQLDALLELYRREPDPRLDGYLRTWLDAMAAPGLYDPVGGGFFRYSTDAEWRSPHCEKMLGDNAQLALIYLKAADLFKQPRYRRIAHGTLDFMLARMQDKRGGLVASLSSVDDRHRPCGAYLWRKETLQQVLDGDEYRAVAKIWALEELPRQDDGYLPVHRLEPDAGEAEALQSAYRKLAAAGQQRTPARDDKRVAALNGLALRAFSVAARNEPRYAAAARQLRNFALGRLWQDGTLAKAVRQNRRIGQGELEDHAFLAAGLLAYADLANSEADRRSARAILAVAWRNFYGRHAWKAQKRSLLAANPYQILVEDSATPSPSAMLIGASLQSGDAKLAEQGRQALQWGHEILEGGTFWHATQVVLLQPLGKR